MMMKKCAMALAAVLILSLPLAARADLPKVGGPMVPFVLETDAGEKVDSATLVGKGPIVISFVNTVCGTCNEELTDMKKFLDKNPGKVQFYPIIVDARPAVTIKPFKEATGFPFTFLIDSNFVYGRKYGATFSPFTVVVGKDGNIAGILRGYNDNDAADLQKLIK